MPIEIETHHDEYFLTCPRGMAELMSSFVKELDHEVADAGVTIRCSKVELLPVIFHNPLANRVLKKLFSFSINHEKEIAKNASEYPWEELFTPRKTFKVRTTVHPDLKYKKGLHNTMFLSLTLKDGIVDRFNSQTGIRPDVSKDNPELEIVMHIQPGPKKEIMVNVFVDLLGWDLSHRGYRRKNVGAPLRENLAAAIILASGWDKDQEILVDPFCGSGTILCEAAIMKLGLPPCFLKILNRHYSFHHLKGGEWLDLKDQYFPQLKKEIKEKLAIAASLKPFLYGSDENQNMLNISRDCLAEIGFSHLVKIQRNDATTVRPPEGKVGVVVTNPPYGERVGNIDELNELYHQFGENLKKQFKNYRAYILTGELSVRKAIHLQTSKRIPFYNGPIECRLYEYLLR